MSSDLQQDIIDDLMRDYPAIKEIERTDNCLIIKADPDTLWEIFEVLYSGMDNVELNLDKNEESHIVINI
jgi:hypothetical protein